MVIAEIFFRALEAGMIKEGVGTPDGALEMVKGQMALTLTEKIHPETGDKTRRRWKSRGME